MVSQNPMLTRLANRDRQSKAYHRSPKQEKATAKRLGGHRISGSGSGFTKGDVRIRGICRIEAKTTQAKSFSVSRDMLEKISNASMANDEVPVIVVEFLDELGKPVGEVAVMPMWAVDRLVTDAKATKKT